MDLLRAEISSWSGFQDERRERPELPNQLYDFLKRLLALDPVERPSADEILTAIRTEKGLESPSRSRHASNAGLGGRIIQSFDSPVPPSTPVNGNIWPRMSFPLLINAEPNKRRVRSEAYIEDASGPESSRTPSPSSQLVLETSHSRSRSQQAHHHRHESLAIKPSITTPLLMPPPSTTMSTFKHRVSLSKHYFDYWMMRNQQSSHMIFQLAVFLIKMLSITRPCTPLVTKEAIWWPLMALAAFELAGGNKFGWKGFVALAVVHIVVLASVMRFGGGMCVRW